MALAPFHLQFAGVVILIAIALAMGWWVVRTAMGWHRGSTFAWFHPRADEETDELDDEDEPNGNGADVR
jgi:hypothetical protein